MIQCYTLINSTPTPIDSPGLPSADSLAADSDGPLWIDLVNSTPEEREAVNRRYGIPMAHLEAVLDANERPRVESSESCILIVARTPFQNDPVRRVTYSTCPIAAIVTEKVLITVCSRDGIALELLSTTILGSESRMVNRLVLTLLLRVSSKFIQQLQLMDLEVGQMELALKESMQNQELIKMLHLEKSLIYFLTALKGNQSVMEKIRISTQLSSTPEGVALLDDVFIENKQATDMAEIYTQIMGSLSDALGAIVSNNLNTVMKVLTGLTIVFMIPSIIGALYGMNVALPFAESPYAFTVLCLTGFGISLGVFYLLRKKDWM